MTAQTIRVLRRLTRERRRPSNQFTTYLLEHPAPQ